MNKPNKFNEWQLTTWQKWQTAKVDLRVVLYRSRQKVLVIKLLYCFCLKDKQTSLQLFGYISYYYVRKVKSTIWVQSDRANRANNYVYVTLLCRVNTVRQIFKNDFSSILYNKIYEDKKIVNFWKQ